MQHFKNQKILQMQHFKNQKNITNAIFPQTKNLQTFEMLQKNKKKIISYF